MSQWQPQRYDDDPWGERPLPPPAVPPQFRQDARPQPRYQPAPPRYQPPPPPRQYRAPAPRPAPAVRRLPPYPSRQVRFPWHLMLRSRRRRGPSLFHVVYLGTHPVALLMSLFISAFVIEFVVAWIVLVFMAWASWAAAVTVGWLCQAAVAALRR